jgi:hypothetical protein
VRETYGWYNSYLIRVWHSEKVGGEGEPPTWQGEMINIQTGDKIRFEKLEKLLQHLQKQVEVLDSERLADLNQDGFPR